MTDKAKEPVTTRLDMAAAVRWLNEQQADATIEYLREDLVTETVDGPLFVDLEPQANRPHILLVSDTFGYQHKPLVRAAVALHLSNDMTFIVTDETQTKGSRELFISRSRSGESITDPTLGDQEVTIRFSDADMDTGEIWDEGDVD